MRIELVPAEATYPLREQVLRPQGPVAESRYATDHDPSTVHAAAFDDGDRVVCVATIAVDPAPSLVRTDVPPEHQWRLRGMATDPELRGTGVGTQVLSFAISIARERGAELFWCNGRTTARRFYEKQGWVTLGEEFEIPNGGLHFVMQLTN